MAFYEVLVGKSLHTYKSIHSIIGIDIEHVLYSTSFRVFVAFGYLIHLEPITLSSLCKEEHCIVHGGCIDIFNEVTVTCVASS